MSSQFNCVVAQILTFFYNVLILLKFRNFVFLFLQENLKIGCFPESPANREFRVSPGNYRPWSLTPHDCVRLCGDLKYPLSALQNGNLCFCASTFNSSRQQSSNCTINCTGDSSYHCGGTWENLVYNSSSFKDELVINYSSSLTVFKWINLSAVFVNRSSPALRVAFNIGDGNGESLGENAEFRFRAVYWGKIIVKAQVLNAFSVGFVQRDIFIKAFPGRAELNCPSTVRTEDTFHCTAKIYEGTTLAATWMFQNGSERNISLPSKFQNAFMFVLVIMDFSFNSNLRLVRDRTNLTEFVLKR